MVGYTIQADEYAVFRFEEKHIADFWDYFCSIDNQALYNLNIEKPRFEIFNKELQPKGVTEIYFPTHDREVKVVALGEIKLVGIRVVCETGEQYAEEIPGAFAELTRRLEEIPGRIEPERIIGAFFVSDESAEEDGYWACVEVEQFVSVPQEMEAITVPPQSYAVTVHRGRVNQISKTYELLHKWIAENGYERVLRAWHLEQYEKSGPVKGPVTAHLHDTITLE
ncbi:GyrI-like domain-containing protein [Paenibacillus sp. sptzw28]|nr:GyrI-like domain-containing protein [Paenibacillus sp. sptzw28]